MAVGGLYSTQQIDLRQIKEALESSISPDLNLGLLVLVKSGLPGFVVEPIVKEYLKEHDFSETNIGELTIYKGSRNIGGEAVPVLLRIEGNRLFAAASRQLSYAETLITGPGAALMHVLEDLAHVLGIDGSVVVERDDNVLP